MEKYDYRKAVCDDIRDYINDNGIKATDYTSREEMFEALNDALWVEDSVTGNGSGSYTFNTWKAEENLCHNLDLLGQAMEEFGCSPEDLMTKGPNWADVTIRCWLLSECIYEVIDELFPYFWDED